MCYLDSCKTQNPKSELRDGGQYLRTAPLVVCKDDEQRVIEVRHTKNEDYAIYNHGDYIKTKQKWKKELNGACDLRQFGADKGVNISCDFGVNDNSDETWLELKIISERKEFQGSTHDDTEFTSNGFQYQTRGYLNVIEDAPGKKPFEAKQQTMKCSPYFQESSYNRY